MAIGDKIVVASAEQLETVKGEVLTSANDGLSTQFAQHGLVPNDNINEITPSMMFEEVDVADTLVDKKGYPVRFTDGVYDRLGEELVTNGDFSDEVLATSGVTSNGWKNYGSGGTLSTENGRLKLVNPAGLQQFITLDVGKTYEVTLDIYGDNVTWYLGTSSSDENIHRKNNANSTQKFIFTASGTSLYFHSFNESGSTSYLDNISVKELPQFALPKAPFAGTAGSIGISSTKYDYAFNGATHTDVLLNDKDDGITVPVDMKAGGIVVTGSELVTNGTFDTDTSGWTASNSTLSIDTQRLKVVNVGANYGLGVQIITVDAGVEYTISFELINGTTSANLYIHDDTTLIDDITTSGKHTIVYTFTSTVLKLQCVNFSNTDAEYAFFDNISVKLKDQSYIATEDTTAGDLLAYPEWISGQAKSVDAMVQNDSKVYKCIQAVVGDEDPAIAITDTAYWTYQFDSKFKTIPYVTKQVALLIEKTSAGEVLNTVKPLVNCYGEESVETYESDIFAELGYSQVSDRVYTDGASEFILVGLKGFLA